MKKQIKKKLLKGFLLGTLTVCVLGMCAGCGQKTENIENTVTSPTAQEQTGKTGQKSLSWSELTQTGSMDLSYADQFSVTYYGEENYALVIIGEDEKFLVVPEGEPVPEDLPEDITPLLQPLTNMYLAATSAMDFFCHLDAVDQITLSGTDRSGWYLEEPKKALEEGTMEYAGKYSAPDYERIVDKSCSLAIESTMIYHCPQVKEQLENLGVPVLVERSSYESHPLGRTEWMKLYAVLLGKEDVAEKVFKEQTDKLDKVLTADKTDKTVAFFYINSVGAVNIRKSGDYVSEMISLAGGNYVPEDTGVNDNALSTMNMQMEEFYAKAKDADYIIYNSTIDGELKTIDELLSKSKLLADFKAVKNGNVWCTGKNLFQETTGLGTMIEDIHTMLTTDDDSLDELTYMHKLK